MEHNTDNCGAALHQKRLLAFVNHFLLRNIQFFNNFSCICEEKLITFENKMNKIEASLKILESQLASVPDVQSSISEVKLNEEIRKVDKNDEKKMEGDIQIEEIKKDEPSEVRDPQYDKFFKMIQVGVPIQAVRLKVIQEGLDPDILEQR